MLFRQEFLEDIRKGSITLAFRRWRRPTVRSGGTLLTPVGELDIVDVGPAQLAQITKEDAQRAGYSSLALLLKELDSRKDGEIYRIQIGALRLDPRIALREASASGARELDEIMEKLHRLDTRAARPWTGPTLDVLGLHPGVRAGVLSELLGQKKEQLKRNVRKLKGMGLTESLGTGYRLSVRGRGVLDALQAGRPSDI
jgi:hypothetical protein